MDQGRDYGKVSEALVSGVEFKEVPQNLAINQEKYFDKMFQNKSQGMQKICEEQNYQHFK